MATQAQSGKNFVIAYKVETTFNTPPSVVTGAQQLRLIASPGMSLKIASITSKEMRSDGLSPIARHGSRDAGGSYACEMLVGAHDVLYEAVMRATWATATTINAQSVGTLTSIAATAPNAIVAGSTAAGGFIAAGVRVGDVFRLSGVAAGDANVNLRALSVSTGTIITQPTPALVVSTVTTTFTMTILKKLTNPSVPVKRTFYFQEHNVDIGVSEVYGGNRIVGMDIKGTPNGMAEVTFTLVGASGVALASGSSPFYTAPTLSTSLPLVFADAVLSYKGVDVALLTAFDLKYAIAAKTEPVIGSPVSPDVFDNDATLSGTMSMIRQDLQPLTDFLAETEFELHIQLVEPMSEPKNGIWIYIPRCKLMSAADGGMGNDGAMVNTLNWSAGIKAGYASTGYDPTLLNIYTSAP